MDGAQIGIVGGILGSILGCIGAMVGVYVPFYIYVRNVFEDESLDNTKRKIKIQNYIRLVFALTSLVLLWIGYVWSLCVFADPSKTNLFFTLMFGGIIVFIAAIFFCIRGMKGGREALRYSRKHK